MTLFPTTSWGSKHTLAFQGGPMSAAEAAIFEADLLFDACVTMRRWDDGAKRPLCEVPPLEAYEARIRACIVAPRRTIAQLGAVSPYRREGNVIVGVNKEICQNLPAWRPAPEPPGDDAGQSRAATAEARVARAVAAGVAVAIAAAVVAVAVKVRRGAQV